MNDDQVIPCLDTNILKLNESAFSLDVSNKLTNDGSYLVALGLENGDLILSKWSPTNGWTKLKELNRFHTITICKVRFNPVNLDGRLLATCGDDCFVRIVKINKC